MNYSLESFFSLVMFFSTVGVVYYLITKALDKNDEIMTFYYRKKMLKEN